MPKGNYEPQIRRFAAQHFTRKDSAPGVDAETCSDRWICSSLDALFCPCADAVREKRIDRNTEPGLD